MVDGENICTRRSSRKSDLKYYGPFPFAEQIGKQAYKLRLGDSAGCINPVFHVFLQKLCLLTT
jgi:hypothetical protein